jgi:hypothetical protein
MSRWVKTPVVMEVKSKANLLKHHYLLMDAVGHFVGCQVEMVDHAAIPGEL